MIARNKHDFDPRNLARQPRKLHEGVEDRLIRRADAVKDVAGDDDEVGRELASRGKGVVRDESVRAEAIASAARSVAEAGFDVLGQRDSDLAGPKGNLEAFVHARRT